MTQSPSDPLRAAYDAATAECIRLYKPGLSYGQQHDDWVAACNRAGEAWKALKAGRPSSAIAGLADKPVDSLHDNPPRPRRRRKVV